MFYFPSFLRVSAQRFKEKASNVFVKRDTIATNSLIYNELISFQDIIMLASDVWHYLSCIYVVAPSIINHI